MKIADRIRGIYDASIERVEAERKAEELRRNKNVEQDIVRAKDIAKELFNTVIHSIETEASKGIGLYNCRRIKMHGIEGLHM